MIRIFFTGCVAVMLLAGCVQQPEIVPAPSPRVKRERAEQEIDFARMVLERKQYQLEIARDPFEPLDLRGRQGGGITYQGEQDNGLFPKLLNLTFLGSVRTPKGFGALVRLDKELKTLLVGDVLKEYRVTAISVDQIELQHVEQTEHSQIITRRDASWNNDIHYQQSPDPGMSAD